LNKLFTVCSERREGKKTVEWATEALEKINKGKEIAFGPLGMVLLLLNPPKNSGKTADE
jgi:hypothetical protein